uniref:WD_REPEATS_REGION domain-containing protein n=1 Tax=Macrostomum lignano TaxID=282301 RepID=A0A1I8FGW1_9PLAT
FYKEFYQLAQSWMTLSSSLGLRGSGHGLREAGQGGDQREIPGRVCQGHGGQARIGFLAAPVAGLAPLSTNSTRISQAFSFLSPYTEAASRGNSSIDQKPAHLEGGAQERRLEEAAGRPAARTLASRRPVNRRPPAHVLAAEEAERRRAAEAAAVEAAKARRRRRSEGGGGSEGGGAGGGSGQSRARARRLLSRDSETDAQIQLTICPDIPEACAPAASFARTPAACRPAGTALHACGTSAPARAALASPDTPCARLSCARGDPDGGRAVSAGWDKAFCPCGTLETGAPGLWRRRVAGSHRQRTPGFLAATAVASCLSADERCLATCSWDKRILMYDISTGMYRSQGPKIFEESHEGGSISSCCRLSADGAKLRQRLLRQHRDVWTPRTACREIRLQRPRDWVETSALSADGAWMMSAMRRTPPCGLWIHGSEWTKCRPWPRSRATGTVVHMKGLEDTCGKTLQPGWQAGSDRSAVFWRLIDRPARQED